MRCAGQTYDRFGFHPCPNTGKVEDNGKWWCKIHHPPTVKAKADVREAKWRAKIDAISERQDTSYRNRRLAEKALEWLRENIPARVKMLEMEIDA